MDSSTLWIVLLFCVGYLGIVFEHQVKVDKAATALLTGIGCWLLYFHLSPVEGHAKIEELNHHLSGIAQVLFFLIGAMLIVEVIDSHHGFQLLGSVMRFKSKLVMFWTILIIAFFVSSVLDNLTTIIVMIALLKKLIPDTKQRLAFTAPLVVAVNAGGAWTPIGDVTTTMLWIADRVSTYRIMERLFIPSIGALIVFGLLMLMQMPKTVRLAPYEPGEKPPVGAKRVFWIGLGTMIMVPILKTTIGVPPFLGMSLGVGVLWLVTDLLHYDIEERHHLRVYNCFGRIDMACIFFFFGMLLAVDALQSSGALRVVSEYLELHVGSYVMIATLIGLISAVVDNIPLVAACIEMYPLSLYATDHRLWELLAFTAGTGGSILIIGSAAGVACMSLEKVSFQWYLRHMSWAALVSYFAGIGLFLLLP